MNSLAIHVLPAIRTLPRLPQMIVVAVAVAYVILPIAPVIPIPTVGGVAHAASWENRLEQCIDALGDLTVEAQREVSAWMRAMESGSGYRSPPVSLGGSCNVTLSEINDAACSAATELSIVAGIQSILKGTTALNHALQGRRWMVAAPRLASLWGAGIGIGASVYDWLFCSK